jgi:hypothetical protein
MDLKIINNHCILDFLHNFFMNDYKFFMKCPFWLMKRHFYINLICISRRLIL